MSSVPELLILGGGPAGLAAGHFARERSFPFQILEAREEVGGNARTLSYSPSADRPEVQFRFDTGAHRFHDRNPQATRIVRELLGDDLVKIDVPSRIDYRGRLVRFPLSPGDLCLKLGPLAVARGIADLARARKAGAPTGNDFESHAVHRYGRTIAETFLLGYSEKLWGLPCHRLSKDIGGERTRGLDLRTLAREWILGARSGSSHLDGSFYYPRGGIGRIPEALAESCGRSRIRTLARITRLQHDGRSIRAVEVNGDERIEVQQLISTLPMTRLISSLDPPAPPEIVESARSLRFRNVVLVMVALARERVSPYGSIYFSDSRVPFTRMYEPKNRGESMAPPGATSLVVEIPCGADDPVWNAQPETLSQRICELLQSMKWIRAEEVLGTCVERIGHAYPVLELENDVALRILMDYLQRFENLVLAGRNGRFAYAHIHDMIEAGRASIDAIEQRRRRFELGSPGISSTVSA